MTNTARPDTTALNDEQRARVQRQLRRRGVRCSSCGGDRFLVGDALYLGFLFLSEDNDAYMVALTCTSRDCPDPRTGIRLHESEFLIG